MSASIKNLYQFRTTSKITQAQAAASTFTVGNDIFTNTAVSITAWSIQLTNRTGSIVELFTVTIAAWTATIAARGIKPDGTTDTIYQYERPRNTLCTVTVLENQITNKVDVNTFTEDQTIQSWNKLKLWADAYVWTENDGTDLKFKDGNNTEKTLTQLSSLSGSNDKVKISATDTTEAFLNFKVTAGDWLTKTTINPSWNEVIDFDIDLTDTTIFSSVWVASRAVVTDWSGNLFQATTSNRWWSEMNTDAEFYTWTDATRYVNALQVNSYFTIIAWTNIFASADTARSVLWTTYTKVKEITILKAGTYTIDFDLRNWWATTWYWRVYKNGVAFGTEQTQATDVYTTKSENLIFAAWDLCQLYLKHLWAWWTAYAQNFRVKWALAVNPEWLPDAYIWTVVTD